MGRSSLPDANTPLTLSDGSVVSPTAAQSFSRSKVPSNSAAQRLVSSTNRKLADLPAPPKQLNVFAVLVMYTAAGLSDSEISLATGLDGEQIAILRDNPIYTQLEGYVSEAVMYQSKEQVAGVLAEAEVESAKKIVAMAHGTAPADKVMLAANQDILNRRGHVPKQVIDIRAEMQNTFRIEYVDKRVSANIIDVEVL